MGKKRRHRFDGIDRSVGPPMPLGISQKPITLAELEETARLIFKNSQPVPLTGRVVSHYPLFEDKLTIDGIKTLIADTFGWTPPSVFIQEDFTDPGMVRIDITLPPGQYPPDLQFLVESALDQIRPAGILYSVALHAQRTEPAETKPGRFPRTAG